MTKIVKIISVLSVLLVFVVLISKTSAAGEGLTISPPINELSLKAGEQSQQTIKVTNPTGALMEVYPTVMNFKASGEGGEPAFFPTSDEESKFSVAHWITFSQSKVALAPEQVVDFSYTIDVPADAESGGHYGAIFLATQPPKVESNQSQVSIGSMIGSLILIRVPGPTIEKAYLEKFSSLRFAFAPPVGFETKIANLGNIHFKPKGEILIKDFSGNQVDKLVFNESTGNVLPDSTRKFENVWGAKSSFLQVPLGRFTADLRVVYGESDKTLSSQIVFWIVPYWAIASLALLVIVIIIAIILIRKKRGRKHGYN